MCIGQGNRELVIGNISNRSILNELIYTGRQVTEFSVSVLVNGKCLATIFSSHTITIFSHFSLNHIAFGIFQGKFNISKRLIGKGIYLIEHESDGFVCDLGLTGHFAVNIHFKGKCLRVQGKSAGFDSFLVGVFPSRNFFQDDFAILIGLTLKENIARFVINGNGGSRNSLPIRKVCLFENHFIANIGSVNNRCVFVVCGNAYIHNFIRKNKASGRINLLKLIFAYRKVDGYCVTVRIRGHSVKEFPFNITDLKLCTCKHPVCIVLIRLPYSNIAFEHIVYDGSFIVNSISTVYSKGERLAAEINGLIRNFQFFQVILAKGQLHRAGRNTFFIGGKQFYQSILGHDPDSFSSIKPENKAFTNTGFELQFFIIKAFGHLFKLYRSCNAGVFYIYRFLNNGSVLVSIGDCHGMNSVVHLITCNARYFLDFVFTKFQKSSFRIPIGIGGKSCNDRSLAVFYFKNTTRKTLCSKLRSVDLPKVGIACSRTNKLLGSLIDADHALCRSVLNIKCFGFIESNRRILDRTLKHIRGNGRKLLYIHLTNRQRRRSDGAISAGGQLAELARAADIRIHTKFYACKRSAIIPSLSNLQVSIRRSINANTCRCNNLCSSRAQEDFLKISIRRNICGEVGKASCILTRCSNRKVFPGSRIGNGKRNGLALAARISAYGSSGRKRRGIERILAVDIGELYLSAAYEVSAIGSKLQRRRRKYDRVSECFLGTGIRKQRICPFKDVLITCFSSNVRGVCLSVGKTVGTRFAIF